MKIGTSAQMPPKQHASITCKKEHFVRENIISHHRSTLEQLRVKEMLGIKEDYHSQAPATIPPSKKPFDLNTMQKIDISQLLLSADIRSNPNVGKYFQGKIVEEPFQMSSIMTILEDVKDGKVVQVAIYNYKLSKSLHEEFKVGRVMIIKNPFYKVYVDGWPGIRVDDPSNICFIDPITKPTLAPSIKEKPAPSSAVGQSLPKWQIVRPQFEMYKRALHAGFVVDNQTLVYWGGVSPQGDTFVRATVPTAELVMYDTHGMNSFYPTPKGQLPSPGHRNGHCFVLDYEGKYAYLIGGAPSDGVFVLNIETIEWKKLKGINVQRINCCCAAVPGYIYIFGGRSAVGSVPCNDMFRIDTQKLTIEKVNPTSKQVPKGRSSACLERVKGRFLVLYGGDCSMTSCCDDLWIFDTKHSSWHNIIVTGQRPIGLGLSGWAKYIDPNTRQELALLFYGGLSISGTMKNDLWLLNINTLHWNIVETASTTMKALSHHTNLVAGNKLYIYGGTDTVAMAPNIINTMYCLDISHSMDTKKIESCTWTCNHCESVTFNKCSKCSMVQFCDRNCQGAGMDKHGAECAKFCGEDETSKKFTLEKEYYEKLLKQNEEKNLIISENKQRIEELENMFRKMTKALHEKEELVKFTMNQEEQLVLDINQKTNEIRQYEDTYNAIIEQTDLQRKEFEEEIKRLHQERNKLSEAQKRAKNNVNLLQEQVKSLKTSLDQAEQHSAQKIQHLSSELEKNQLEIKKQKEVFDNTKNELANLRKEIEQLNEQKECPICFENERNHVLQPCGHVFCLECIPKSNVPKTKLQCPICCQQFSGYVRMYF